MTIKKTAATAAAPASGGAAIANRFKLDAPDPSARKGAVVNARSAATAFFIALVALGVAGFLVYTLWKHWEFLMPA